MSTSVITQWDLIGSPPTSLKCVWRISARVVLGASRKPVFTRLWGSLLFLWFTGLILSSLPFMVSSHI
jgi:hypothetical protein